MTATMYRVCACINMLPHSHTAVGSHDEIRTRFSLSRDDAPMDSLFAVQTEKLFLFSASSWRDACERFERWVELQIAVHKYASDEQNVKETNDA